MLGLLTLLTLLAPLVSANLATIYWPVFTPNPSTPWIVGQKNVLSWETGGATGIEVFDIQLHNVNETVMHGFLPIALRVPMTKGARRGNYGGTIDVDLEANVPTGPGFVLMFLQTLHGQVYARSQQFEILAAPPSNFSSVADDAFPPATRTATLDHMPNPTQQWAITLDGPDPDATRTATVSIAGNQGA